MLYRTIVVPIWQHRTSKGQNVECVRSKQNTQHAPGVTSSIHRASSSSSSREDKVHPRSDIGRCPQRTHTGPGRSKMATTCIDDGCSRWKTNCRQFAPPASGFFSALIGQALIDKRVYTTNTALLSIHPSTSFLQASSNSQLRCDVIVAAVADQCFQAAASSRLRRIMFDVQSS